MSKQIYETPLLEINVFALENELGPSGFEGDDVAPQ